MAFSFSRIILEDTGIEIYKRGLEYFKRKRVSGKTLGTAAYQADVKGTHNYIVSLGFTRIGSPKYQCSCPYYSKNKLVCKHIIAASLAWDDSRSVDPPTLDDTKLLCIPPPDVTYTDIKKTYANPLHTDLTVIRLAADNTGKWSRPHAHLPQKPRVCQKDFHHEKDFLMARKALLNWSNRRGFDTYFCAGEMEAGFCEILRWLEKSFSLLQTMQKLQVLKTAVELHHEVLNCIDDSDGLHIFGEAHLYALCESVKNDKNISESQQDIVKKLRADITAY